MAPKTRAIACTGLPGLLLAFEGRALRGTAEKLIEVVCDVASEGRFKYYAPHVSALLR